MQHKHFDIFKRTMEILPELNKILAEKSLTPRERVKQHLAKIFGRDCVDMVERANRKWAEKHPESKHIEPQIDEKDLVSPASDEWDQAAATHAVKIALGSGFENLTENTEAPTAHAKST